VRYGNVSAAFKIKILVEFITKMATARIRLILIASAILELILRKCYESIYQRVWDVFLVLRVTFLTLGSVWLMMALVMKSECLSSTI